MCWDDVHLGQCSFWALSLVLGGGGVAIGVRKGGDVMLIS